MRRGVDMLAVWVDVLICPSVAGIATPLCACYYDNPSQFTLTGHFSPPFNPLRAFPAAESTPSLNLPLRYLVQSPLKITSTPTSTPSEIPL